MCLNLVKNSSVLKEEPGCDCVMANGQSFVDFAVTALTKSAPPEVWGIILLMTFMGYMAFKRMPASVSGHIGFILVFSMASMIFGLQGSLFGCHGCSISFFLQNRI